MLEIVHTLGQFFLNACFLGMNAFEALYLSVISVPGLTAGCIFLGLMIIWGVHRVCPEITQLSRLMLVGVLFSSVAALLYLEHVMWLWPLGLLASIWVVLRCPVRQPVDWIMKRYRSIGLSMVVFGMVLSCLGNSIGSMLDLALPMHWAWILGLFGGSAAFLMYGVQMYQLTAENKLKKEASNTATHTAGFWESWIQRLFAFIGQVNFYVVNPALVSVGGLLLLSNLSTSGTLFSLWSLALGGAWFWACGMVPAYMVTYDFLIKIGQRIGRWLDRPRRFSGATVIACIIALPTVLGSMGNAYWCGENILMKIEYLLHTHGLMVQWLHAYPILNPILGFIFMGLTFFSAGALYFTFTEQQLETLNSNSSDEVSLGPAVQPEASAPGSQRMRAKCSRRNFGIGLYVLIASGVMTAIYADRLGVMLLEWHLSYQAVILVSVIAMIFVFTNFALSFWNRTLEAKNILGNVFGAKDQNQTPVHAKVFAGGGPHTDLSEAHETQGSGFDEVLTSATPASENSVSGI